jgi:UDP-GlcNAc:undecaprenyl-phosphate GlcNAc-1-phosphate transferase
VVNTKFRLFWKPCHFLATLFFLLLAAPPVREWWFRGGGRWLYIFLFSFCLSYLLTPLFRYIAKEYGIMDYPDKRKTHAKPTPLLGGTAIFLAFLSAILVNFIIDQRVAVILLGATLLMAIGIWDDFREVSAGKKLLAQILAAMLLIKFEIVIKFFPMAATWGSIGNILLTLLWIIGITNAFNFFDGMDGLAAGLGAIIASFLGIIAFQTYQPFLGWLSAAIVGSCLGFLPYNFRLRKPAAIFLGDSGSIFLGFLLAALAVMGEWADNDPFVSLTNPLLVFGVLIFDMFYITISRIYAKQVVNFGQWISYVGKDHLHHRLYAVLRNNKWTAIFIFFLSGALGISALGLRKAHTIDAILLISQAIIMLILMTVLERAASFIIGFRGLQKEPGTGKVSLESILMTGTKSEGKARTNLGEPGQAWKAIEIKERGKGEILPTSEGGN